MSNKYIKLIADIVFDRELIVDKVEKQLIADSWWLIEATNLTS